MSAHHPWFWPFIRSLRWRLIDYDRLRAQFSTRAQQ